MDPVERLEVMSLVDVDKTRFGDVLLYMSRRRQNLKTPCVYIRRQNKDTAVVVFKNSQTVAKVSYDRLVYPPVVNGEIDAILDNF